MEENHARIPQPWEYAFGLWIAWYEAVFVRPLFVPLSAMSDIKKWM